MPQNPTAIITGASSGVGRATSIAMAAAGYNLVLVARRKEQLEETAAMATRAMKLPGVGAGEIMTLPTDLTDTEATRGIVGHAMKRFGRIDALANIAGDAPLLPIEKVTQAIWQRCIDANLSYIVHLTSAAWPVFRGQKGGVIVNVSSMASIDPFPGLAIYAAAKAGVNLFTLSTANEGKEIGVRAVALALGAVETPMLRGLFDEKAIPRSRTLDPVAVAAVIRDYITSAKEFESGATVEMKSP